jgi:hypothetical protein
MAVCTDLQETKNQTKDYIPLIEQGDMVQYFQHMEFMDNS